MQDFFSFLLSIDKQLVLWLSTLGPWTYLVLFLVIFCETGLVVTPFLPGDSLLFVAGSLATQPSLNIFALLVLLIAASFLGNQLNYTLGRFIGPKVFRFKNSWLLNQKHLREAHQFYERHGKMTLIIARFIPIIRTFAPFVAGVGTMSLPLFTVYNAVSAVLWVGSLLMTGYFLGSIPFLQVHLSLVIYGIIVVSLLPVGVAFCNRRLSQG